MLPAPHRPRVQVEALLSQAMERRSVSATQLNDQSSRSHMVFTLRIDGTNSATGAVPAGHRGGACVLLRAQPAVARCCAACGRRARPLCC